jgi:hypothetical protein
MAYKRTEGKVGRPKKGYDSHGNPIQQPEAVPEIQPSGIALSVAETRRSDAVRHLEAELARIDREPVFSMSGQPLPEHIRRQRVEGRRHVAANIERLRALSGYELVAEFAPQFLPRTEPQAEPVRFEETLLRGSYGPKAVNGAPVVVADPTFMARHRARMAEQAEQAEHEARIKRGQEAIALGALAE